MSSHYQKLELFQSMAVKNVEYSLKKHTLVLGKEKKKREKRNRKTKIRLRNNTSK